MKKILIMFGILFCMYGFADDNLDWKYITGAAGSTKINSETIGTTKQIVLRAFCAAIKNSGQLYFHTGSNDEIAGASDIFDYIFMPDIDSDGNDELL